MSASSKTTVTVKLAVPTFPALSVAVHVIVLIPIGRSVLCAGEQLLEAISQLCIIFPLLSHTGGDDRSGSNAPQLCEVPSHELTDEFIPE